MKGNYECNNNKKIIKLPLPLHFNFHVMGSKFKPLRIYLCLSLPPFPRKNNNKKTLKSTQQRWNYWLVPPKFFKTLLYYIKLGTLDQFCKPPIPTSPRKFFLIPPVALIKWPLQDCFAKLKPYHLVIF